MCVKSIDRSKQGSAQRAEGLIGPVARYVLGLIQNNDKGV